MAPLDVARAGRWADWHGLDEPSLTALGKPGSGEDSTALGKPGSGEDSPALVILDDPPHGDGLEAIGEPDLVQPARHELFGFETTEHVWPRRGLVLVVAVPYDHTPADDRTPRIVRAELFAPTSLDEWRAEIAPRSAPQRPKPARRG